MAWTTPRTWTTGELVTAALLNTHVRDNELYLKALFSTTTGHNHDGTGTDAGPKVNADTLDGQHGSYYASASSLSSHAGTSSGTHGLDSGVYFVGCKQGTRRFEFKQFSRSDYNTGGNDYWFNKQTVSVTWQNAFSSVLGVWVCGLRGAYCSGISFQGDVTSISTTGASCIASWCLQTYQQTTTVYFKFLALGT